MTSVEEAVQVAEKRTLYTFVSDLGEYFIWVFVKIAKFIGMCFMYLFAVVYDPLMSAKGSLGKFFSNIGNTLLSPFRRRHKALKLGKAQVDSARREKGAWGAAVARAKIAGRTVFGKRGLLVTLVNWTLPVLSFIFMFNIISYANSQNYALKLVVNGDFIGYISDDTMFSDAEKMVQNRINYTGSNTEIITFEPVYEIENVGSAALLNQYQVADKMLMLLGKEVAEGYGLYLGDTYFGTLTSHEALDKAMAELLAQYTTGDATETAEFDRQITYINGTYLADSFVDEQEIIKQFSGYTTASKYYTIKEGDTLETIIDETEMTLDDLKALNPEFDFTLLEDGSEEDPDEKPDEDPDGETGGETIVGTQLKIAAAVPFRTVIVSREEHYTEEFGYETEYINDSLVYAGNQAIQTEGENGEYAIAANVSYINGVEVGRRVISRVVVKQPVTKVIAVGTKPRKNNTAPGQTIGAGMFLWPVGGEDGGYIAEAVSWKGGYSGHKGIDIMAPEGTPVYAAHNGVVTASVYAYNGDARGNYVVIQGDDNFTTYYYHNTQLACHEGQRVTAGDLIAYVGMTGRAYGYHCHFGVSVGGQFLDPIDYLPKHAMSPSVAAWYD